MPHNTPYTAKEKQKALKLLENSTIEFVAHRYKCSVRTLYRWKKKYDGTLESLENKSNRPLTPHPNAHTEEEIKNINALIKRNPTIGLNELYGKLITNYGYTRNPVSLFRFLRKNQFYQDTKKNRKKYKPKPYHTPENIGEKMQLDVKFVPQECKALKGQFDKSFYQYTMIDESTRVRFLYAYDEHTANATCDFVKRAIEFYGYIPKEIQTDNGSEFTYTQETKNDLVHRFDALCNNLGIKHKLIKPRTPRHNGKVERSHRNDNERFYSELKFYSLEDLRHQMKAYVKRSNNIPSSALKWKSPNQKHIELSLKNNPIPIIQENNSILK